jgi:hypothetical protein
MVLYCCHGTVQYTMKSVETKPRRVCWQTENRALISPPNWRQSVYNSRSRRMAGPSADRVMRRLMECLRSVEIEMATFWGNDEGTEDMDVAARDDGMITC